MGFAGGLQLATPQNPIVECRLTALVRVNKAHTAWHGSSFQEEEERAKGKRSGRNKIKNSIKIRKQGRAADVTQVSNDTRKIDPQNVSAATISLSAAVLDFRNVGV